MKAIPAQLRIDILSPTSAPAHLVHRRDGGFIFLIIRDKGICFFLPEARMSRLSVPFARHLRRPRRLSTPSRQYYLIDTQSSSNDCSLGVKKMKGR
jgi:hypothetical protein